MGFNDALVIFIGVYVGLVFVVGVSAKLVKWAKSRKTAAFIFGAAMQMFLPDPNAETQIKMVQVREKKTKSDRESGDPKK